MTGRASLEIPPLFIDYKTGPILRNLVAYEQCNKSVKPYFTSYIMFFDGLVNTPEDVQILRNKRIFYHVLGSNQEVSELLNDRTKDVAYDWHDCYLSPLIHKIHLRRNKTYLKRSRQRSDANIFPHQYPNKKVNPTLFPLLKS
ncbi:UPF0481 protein At3g47200-like [Fagus crenata]